MDKTQIYESLSKVYFSEDMHEKEVIDNLPAILDGVEIFADVGASLGQYTFFANQHMRNGHIFAIEADPIRYEELARNCRVWESLSSNRLTVVQGAACDKDGRTSFYTTNTTISGGLFEHNVSQSVLASSGLQTLDWDEIVVDCLRLDTLFDNQQPDLIKVDVEGSELRVLRGATRILEAGKTRFLIELHGGWVDPAGQQSVNEVHELMASFGYKAVNFHGKALFLKARYVESQLRWLGAKLRPMVTKVRSFYRR